MTGDPNPPDPWRDASFPHHAYVGSLTNQAALDRGTHGIKTQVFMPMPATMPHVQHVECTTKMMLSVQMPVPMMVVPCLQVPTWTPVKPTKSMPSPERSGVVFSASFQQAIVGLEKVPGVESLHMPLSCHHRLLQGAKGGPYQKGCFRKKNPKDKYGQVMRSNACQSDEHLCRKCLKRPQQGGSFATGSASVPSAQAQCPNEHTTATTTASFDASEPTLDVG